MLYKENANCKQHFSFITGKVLNKNNTLDLQCSKQSAVENNDHSLLGCDSMYSGRWLRMV
jgi:hypothetical protein